MTQRHAKVIKWNPSDCDLLQGDVILFALPSNFTFSKKIEIDPSKSRGTLILAEGEISGHHHEISLGIKIPQPTSFRDDAMARDIEVTNPVPAMKARMFTDADAVNKLVQQGHLSTNTLAVGFLEIEGGDAILEHPEHDSWRIPPGSYYVGNQREFDAEAERRVQD